MMYAESRGSFYVQLEDDIVTHPNFIVSMKNFALKKTAAREPWFVIDFCQLGFIGKMFSTQYLYLSVLIHLNIFNTLNWKLSS